MPTPGTPASSATQVLSMLPLSITPTKGITGRGFDQRLDAMQPKVEVTAAAAGYVNYAMAPSMGAIPVVAVPGVPPPTLPPPVPHAYPYGGFSMIPPSTAPPVPPTPSQAYVPPPPPSQPAPPPFFPAFSGYPTQVYPPPPQTPTGQQPPAPRTY